MPEMILNQNGLRALGRIRNDRNRIRHEVISLADARDALEAADQLLGTDVRGDAREWLEARRVRLVKVIAARERILRG